MRIFKKKAKRGFTLVELVVVIAVIAILAAVSVGAYFGITDSANNSKLEQEAKMVHTNLQLVLSANNSNHYMTRDGAYIGDTTIFEGKFNEMTGGAVSYDFKYGSEPTSISKDTIYFFEPSVSSAPGSLTRYTHFGYYSNSIANKRAVVDIVSGKVDVEKTTVEVGGGESGSTVPGASEPGATETQPPAQEDVYIKDFVFKVNNEVKESPVNYNINASDQYVISVESGTVGYTETFTAVCDNEIQNVNNTFTISASSQKTYTITATASTYQETFVVNINPVLATGISVSAVTSDMIIGSSQEVTVSFTGDPTSSAYDVVVTNPDNLTVLSYTKSNDIITLKAENCGDATVQIKTTDGSNLATEVYSINVNPVVSAEFNATVDKNILDLVNNKTASISYNYGETTPTYDKVTYSSEDESVVTVDNYGLITAIGNGTTNVVVTPGTDSSTADAVSIKITVDTKVSSIEFTTLPPENITKGKTATIVAVALPEAAATRTIEYSSSVSSVASIDSATGEITTHKPGETIITAAATDGSGIVATHKLVVSSILINELSIKINDQSTPITVDVEDSTKLVASATISPDNHDEGNVNVTWISSDDSVASINENGEITPIKSGVVTIKAKYPTRDLTSNEITVTVTHLKEVVFSPDGVNFWNDDNAKTYILSLDSSNTLVQSEMEKISDPFPLLNRNLYRAKYDIDMNDSIKFGRYVAADNEIYNQKSISISSISGDYIYLSKTENTFAFTTRDYFPTMHVKTNMNNWTIADKYKMTFNNNSYIIENVLMTYDATFLFHQDLYGDFGVNDGISYSNSDFSKVNNNIRVKNSKSGTYNLVLSLDGKLTITQQSLRFTYFVEVSNDWKNDGAITYVYTWGGSSGDKWIKTEHYYGNVYGFTLPSGYTGYKFVRINPSASSPSWNDGVKWNETGNLDPTKGNLVIISGYGSTSYSSL